MKDKETVGQVRGETTDTVCGQEIRGDKSVKEEKE